MCQFFSCISDGFGKIYYFDNIIRKKIISKELDYETDSHTSIADYFGFKGLKEDSMNKYEFNPLLKNFVIDQINTTDDSESIKQQCLNLDFKTIIPELQIKEIINPKNIKHGDLVNDSEVALLIQWASVWDSVGASVWDSVGDSVRASVWDSVGDSVRDLVWDSVGDSVWDSVGDSVWDSVRDLVWASVWDSVGDSVRDLVWDSVGDSVGAYISSFYIIANWKYIEHEEFKNPFQSCIDLWELGLVPSFNGEVWRLHNMSNNAKVIYEMKK